MKIIKTYEGFKENKPMEEYNDVIDSFLDDLKDISIGFHSTNFSHFIMYCFFIKNYKINKNEISIFLEEIKSACKSINIKFENFINSNDAKINLKSGEHLDYIEMFFYKKSTNFNFYNNERLFTIEEGADKLDLDFNLPDYYIEDYDDQDYYGDYDGDEDI